MTTFTPDELAALQAAGLAVFEGRVIHEAQPPITPEVLAAIQARCAGPVPEALIALWSTSFGGRLDYDLSLRLSDTVSAFSFSELFYLESDGYRDLWGWMDEQLAFESHDGLLHFLPFGGFEYTDRLFVDLRDGSVVAYMRGLPPAWVLRLHEDATGRVATDVRDLFRQLALEDDPYAPTQEYAHGSEVRAAIDAVGSASARDKLHALLRSVVVDWRGALEDGSVSRDERARRLAWGEVVRSDDVALLDRLVDLGCSPAEVQGGGGRLLALDVPVDGALEAGSSVLPLDLCRELAGRGARIHATAVQSSCRNPDVGASRFLAELLASRDPDALPGLIRDLREGAGRQEASAVRVESGQMGSNWTPARYRELAARMTALADHLRGLGDVVSLVVSSFWIDSVTGEFHEHVSWDDGRYQAGLEAYRVSLWGSEAVRRRGARFLPRLARENLRVEHDELDAFVAELDTLDADADALCGELGRDDTDRIRRYLDHFRAAAELGRARGGGVIID